MRNREPPIRCHYQCTSRAIDSRDQLPQDDRGCLRRATSNGKPFTDGFGDRQTDDALAVARHRHGPAAIVGVDAAADQRRIADPARQHRIDAAGRRACRDGARAIQGDGTDRPMAREACFSLREDPSVRAPASPGERVSFQVELAREPTGQRSGQQDVIGLFHDEPGYGDGMNKTFERGDGARPKSGPFHDRCIHPLDTVQLPFGAAAGIEEPGVFKHTDGALDRDQRGSSLSENRMACCERLGKARRLSRRHRTPPRAAVSEDQGTRTGQLRRRSLAC